MVSLYTANQVRALDRLAIEQHGIPGIQLMKRAGRAVLDTLLECWPAPGHLTVYCGGGNNGGDGYIVAALAQQRHIPVTVIALVEGSALTGDARRAFDFAREQGVAIQAFSANTAPVDGVIVDALLGIGLKGPVRELFANAIAQINNSGLPVMAVDIPSGLHSDTGAACSACVRADLTVTFIGRKRGLYTGEGPEQCGEIFFDDLGVPVEVYARVPADVCLLEPESTLARLPVRPRTAHKGYFGHVLVIGGDHGFGGAVLMAAETAARCGAGLVSVATRAEHLSAILARRPEVMVRAVETHHDLMPLLASATVLVVGPGLGRSPWSELLLYHAVQHAVQRDMPVVMDADALNILAEGAVVRHLPGQVILTPHPGEAARLLNIDSALVQQDRFAAVTQLQKQYKATVILKGAGTLVADAHGISLCAAGNPGMASGGMGDVLSGVLGALLAQGLTAVAAAELATCAHATAADVVAQADGERGLLATDLVPVMRRLLNPLDG